MDKPRIYVESCPIIDLVKTQVGLALEFEKSQSDARLLCSIIEAAKKKAVRLFTSTLSIAECTHVGDPKYNKDAEKFFLGLLASGKGGFALIQTTMAICEFARNLRWIYGINLKGAADAIHIASALHLKCDEFLTGDDKILNSAHLLKPLNLRVCRPVDTKCLSDEHRTLPLFEQ